MERLFNDHEVVMIYRQTPASKKQRQIAAIAQMNSCSEDEVKSILRRAGLKLPGER